jgi:lipopolysaccharide transport system permease protein
MPNAIASGLESGSRFSSAYTQSTLELLHSVWRQRRLLVGLAKRDLSDDYAAQGLSTAWALVQPLFLMVVYLFVFTWVFPARVQAPPGSHSDAVVYLLSGIIPWIALSQVMGRSLNSVVGNRSIVKQMAFPLELLPLKSLATPLFLGAASLVFVVAYSGLQTGAEIIPVYAWGIPLLILITGVLFAGVALLLGSIQVFAPQTREFVLMFLNVGIFIHPILFAPGAVPIAVRPVLYLSPFSYLFFCWQDILFFGGVERAWAWCITIAFASVLFVVGARIFIASKPHFGDFL